MNNMPQALFEQVTAALNTSGHADLAEQLQAYRPFDEMLTSGKAAELLGITSTNTVKNWLKGGYFPGAYKTPGGHWRFPRSEVESVRKRLGELRQRNLREDLTPPDLGDDDSSLPLL